MAQPPYSTVSSPLRTRYWVRIFTILTFGPAMNTSIFGLSPQLQYQRPVNMNGHLTITPLVALAKIGMNCMLWSTPNARVIVDCGLMNTQTTTLGWTLLFRTLPMPQNLKMKLRALCLPTGMNHIGALPWLVPHLSNVPITAHPSPLFWWNTNCASATF